VIEHGLHHAVADALALQLGRDDHQAEGGVVVPNCHESAVPNTFPSRSATTPCPSDNANCQSSTLCGQLKVLDKRVRGRHIAGLERPQASGIGCGGFEVLDCDGGGDGCHAVEYRYVGPCSPIKIPGRFILI
jgi:hypothetical protein